MNINITAEYSLWLSVFCIALAALYTYLLYHNDNKLDRQEAGIKIKLMAAFRFLSVFTISFLLLSPLIRTISKTIEKPLLIFVQDDSESILINKDSSYYRGAYQQEVTNFMDKMSDKFDVVQYAFGQNIENEIAFKYDDKYTDYSLLFNQLNSRYLNRNVGAYVLASDGIYNKGISPLYAMRDVTTPVYTIALGDTSIQKDALIANVKSNKIAFLGNLFPLQANVEIADLKGITTNIRLLHKGNELFTKQLTATSNSYNESISIEIEATDIGIQHYQLIIDPVEGEANSINNKYDIAIDIVDSKQKILILSNAPHPDIGALHKTLAKNLNFELELATASEFTDLKKLPKYNLVVLHQLPSTQNSAVQLISSLLKSDVPLLFIHGEQTDFTKFNSLNTPLTVAHKKGVFDNSRASYNKAFPLFELNADAIALINDAPPLIAPYGRYKTTASSNTLFYQKIKNTPTDRPLITFDNFNDRKIAHITGEGIWRWRMYDFIENNNHLLFNEIVNKIVQYLSLKINKEQFVVNAKKIFAENEAVTIQAEVYNDSYELITDAEVRIEIVDEKGKKYEFNLEPDRGTTNTYQLNAGNLNVGQYSYTAYLKREKTTATKSGNFMVMPVNEEAQNTIADHKILYQLSAQNGGKMYYPKELSQLENLLKEDKKLVSVAYIEKNMEDVINLKLIFWLLLILLSVEWFLRKYFGSY